MLQDEIRTADALGAKAKVSFSKGRFNWYLQGAAQGLVADGGMTQTQTFTGWTLKDTGSGNQRNLLTGFTVLAGNWQVAPNFLWRKPLAGPIPADAPAPGRPRNILDDPFAVRGNRETRAAEILFTYDPTPATWMYTWDSDRREDAAFATSFGLVYYQLPHHPGRRHRHPRRRALDLHLPGGASPARPLGVQGAHRLQAAGGPRHGCEPVRGHR